MAGLHRSSSAPSRNVLPPQELLDDLCRFLRPSLSAIRVCSYRTNFSTLILDSREGRSIETGVIRCFDPTERYVVNALRRIGVNRDCQIRIGVRFLLPSCCSSVTHGHKHVEDTEASRILSIFFGNLEPMLCGVCAWAIWLKEWQ